MTVESLQQRLLSMGFQLPKYGPDGDFGGETQAAIAAALDELARLRGIPDAVPTPASPMAVWPSMPTEWMPAADMDRVIVHWTAGAYTASSLDREHYHAVIEGDGNLVKGHRSIKDNEYIGNKNSDHYAAHTRGCNTKSIGISMCCMANAVESPFDAGKFPMTQYQWDAMTSVVAQLCKRYGIAVTEKTVLTHAEVQPTLGIQQRGKWDITRIAFDSTVKGPSGVGSKLRNEVKAKLALLKG